MPQTPKTLADAVDVLADADFYGRKRSPADLNRATALIVSRQGGEGAYAGSFALTKVERSAGIRVFTGELMTSASARHIIGEECCRALRKLNAPGAAADRALKTAEASMTESFIRGIDAAGHPGMFCCGKCMVALWRNVAAGAFGSHEQRFRNGMEFLRKRRDGKGGWNRFPFHYTLLALTEVGPEIAGNELDYASAEYRRRLKRKPGKSPYAQRRHDVMARALQQLE
jgi:hypothetical protein